MNTYSLNELQWTLSYYGNTPYGNTSASPRRAGYYARVQVGGPVQRLSLRLELERGAAGQWASGSERKVRAVASGSERQ